MAVGFRSCAAETLEDSGEASFFLLSVGGRPSAASRSRWPCSAWAFDAGLKAVAAIFLLGIASVMFHLTPRISNLDLITNVTMEHFSETR